MPVETMKLRLRALLAIVSASAPTMAAEMAAVRAELTAPLSPDCVNEAQLEALQARLDALHEAELLTEPELHKLEDVIGDFKCKVQPAAGDGDRGREYEQACRPALSIAKDSMFARQVRRKIRYE